MPRGYKQRTNLIMLALARTGGTALSQALDCHPFICFDRSEPYRYTNYVKDFETVMAMVFDHPGCAVTGGRLSHRHLPHLSDEFLRQRNVHIIHLRRENIVRSVVSERINGMRKEGKLGPGIKFFKHTYGGQDMPRDLHMDPRQLLRMATAWDERNEQLADRVRRLRLPIFNMTYEEYTAGQQEADEVAVGVARRLQDWLQLEYHPLPLQMRRVNPLPLREIIANYDDVAKIFAGTRFEAMLDD